MNLVDEKRTADEIIFPEHVPFNRKMCEDWLYQNRNSFGEKKAVKMDYVTDDYCVTLSISSPIANHAWSLSFAKKPDDFKSGLMQLVRNCIAFRRHLIHKIAKDVV